MHSESTVDLSSYRQGLRFLLSTIYLLNCTKNKLHTATLHNFGCEPTLRFARRKSCIAKKAPRKR
jgi:hypothetical protein